MTVLKEEFQKRGWREGALVRVIGAVDECCIINMPEEDAKQDILTEYREPRELSGTGEIRDGEPHIHCILSKEGDGTVHGHLHWAKALSWYMAVYVCVD